MIQTLNFSQIERQHGTQARTTMDFDVIESYTESMVKGDTFPPIKVVFDGAKYYIADGWHRYHAYQRARIFNIQCEVTNGTERDALLIALGANATHGLRRTNADKRNAVEIALNDNEWQNWSNRKIAEVCNVSEFLVRSIRADKTTAIKCSIDTPEPETRTYMHYGKEKQMNISNLRKPNQDTPKIEYVEPAETFDEPTDEECEQQEYQEFKNDVFKELDYYSKWDNPRIARLIAQLKQIFESVEVTA